MSSSIFLRFSLTIFQGALDWSAEPGPAAGDWAAEPTNPGWGGDVAADSVW